MPHAEFGEFLAAVTRETLALGGVIDVRKGVVKLPEEGDESRPQVLGLQNAAQAYHQAPVKDRAATIREHFRRVLDSTGDPDRRGVTRDYSSAKKVLKVRIYPDDYFPQQIRPEVLMDPVAPGLVAALMYDLPESIVNVRASDAKSWGVGRDELFRVALENVRAEPGIEHSTIDLGNGVSVDALLGDSLFTTSRILFLEESLPARAPFGAVACLPHRHALLFHPIQDLRVIDAVTHLARMGRGMFREGPGSLSPDLYWWRPGRILKLDVRVTRKAVVLTPDGQFMKVLNRLGGPGASRRPPRR